MFVGEPQMIVACWTLRNQTEASSQLPIERSTEKEKCLQSVYCTRATRIQELWSKLELKGALGLIRTRLERKRTIRTIRTNLDWKRGQFAKEEEEAVEERRRSRRERRKRRTKKGKREEKINGVRKKEQKEGERETFNFCRICLNVR